MISHETNNLYVCRYGVDEEGIWDRVPSIELKDVVTGGPVQQETSVQAFWNQNAFYVRFECEDPYSVSDYTNRDDPLYEQDVVEIFIDEEGRGERYAEIVVSPNNVVFDAMIAHDQEDDPLSFIIDSEWETENLATSVETNGNKRIYTLEIPFTNFKRVPVDGTEWRINFFRIDEEENGTRHYQAWSPTGMASYHVAERFGKLRFAAAQLDLSFA